MAVSKHTEHSVYYQVILSYHDRSKEIKNDYNIMSQHFIMFNKLRYCNKFFQYIIVYVKQI